MHVFSHLTTMRARNRVLCPAIADHQQLRAVSLAWNGIGESSKESIDAYSPTKIGSPRQKDAANANGNANSASQSAGSKDVSAAGLALVSMIKKTTSLTELDASNCRLGARLCLELADAIKANK
jgi:hypothetical protein